MKILSEVLKLSTQFLTEKKVDRARRVAEDLISSVLQLKRMDLYLQFDKPIFEDELAVIRDLLKKCARGEPLEYAIGEVDFFGCTIKVDRRVLIPRPETEILVEMIAKRVQSGILWDLCTGSGCIGIALKKACSGLQVTLSDISSDALALARENSKINQVDVEIVQGDLLTPFQGRKADVIVCNPPYISQNEYDQLDPSVRDFEPKQALLAGERGTEIYERFASSLALHLNPGAQVFFEIGAGQADALKKIFPQGELHRDWAGHPRFFFIRF